MVSLTLTVIHSSAWFIPQLALIWLTNPSAKPHTIYLLYPCMQTHKSYFNRLEFRTCDLNPDDIRIIERISLWSLNGGIYLVVTPHALSELYCFHVKKSPTASILMISCPLLQLLHDVEDEGISKHSLSINTRYQYSLNDHNRVSNPMQTSIISITPRQRRTRLSVKSWQIWLRSYEILPLLPVIAICSTVQSGSDCTSRDQSPVNHEPMNHI